MTTAEPRADVTLTWSDLFRLSEFPQQVPKENSDPGYDEKGRMHYKHVRCPCVYIWGFAHDGVFIPYCVGKSNRPFERAMQHYSNLRGGLYPICHRTSLAGFHIYKDEKIDPNGCSGKIYSPDSPWALAHIFLSKNVQDEVAYLLDAFRFVYATWTDERFSTAMIERTVANILKREHLQSTVAKPNHHCTLAHTNNPFIQTLFGQKGSKPYGIQVP